MKMQLLGLLVIAWMAVDTIAFPPQIPLSKSSCPPFCHCETTPEGLHKAICSEIQALLKYSTHHKHHNINILDLSSNEIQNINGELDKFTEVVTVDLSNNNLSKLDKLFRNSKKLVHLNLSANKFKKFSATAIPRSVSSLDLTYNLLHNVPSDLQVLSDLEHLLLEGNPMSCSCDNLKILDHLKAHDVIIDDFICSSPNDKKGHSWTDIKVNETCSNKKNIQETKHKKDLPLDEMMMGDKPDESEMIAEPTTDEKSMPIKGLNDLNTGEVWDSSAPVSDNDDEKDFLGVVTEKHKYESTDIPDIIDGSGDTEIFEGKMTRKSGTLSELNYLTNETTTENDEDFEGSGSGTIITPYIPDSSTDLAAYDYDGSGDEDVNNTTTTEQPFITGPFNRFFLSVDESHVSTESTLDLPRPTLFQGKLDWDEQLTEKSTTEQVEVNEEIVNRNNYNQVDHSKQSVEKIDDKVHDSLNDIAKGEESKELTKSSVGTYVCVGILIVLLVGLIGLTLIKNQARKKRDRHFMRQEKKDTEKADREMVDMNKALLGKPVAANDMEKKLNGNYELVPTHEPSKKNGSIDKRKSLEENIPKEEVTKELAAPPASSSSPTPSENKHRPQSEPPTINEPPRSSVDAPHMNGGHYPESNLLVPSNEYTPVYNRDSGRVRIKLTETPKPKTPVLVTRSRSNAGDIIITPASQENSPTKSTT